MQPRKRSRTNKPNPHQIINPDSMYALGMLYAKGDIIFDRKDMCKLRFGIKYRRPLLGEKRSDNKRKHTTTQQSQQTVANNVFNEFVGLRNKFKKAFDADVTLDLIPENLYSWDYKTIFLETGLISVNSPLLKELFDSITIAPSTLDHVPKYLFDESKISKQMVTLFLQGASDAAGIPPSQNTAAFGTDFSDTPRIDLDLEWNRWYVAIEICRLFQRRLKMPVAYINFGHPSVRGIASYRGQNHQLRIYSLIFGLVNFNFSLKHKKDELANLLRETEEYRKKLSDAKKGKKLSGEHRRKLSDAKKGKTSPNKGKKFSEEYRKKSLSKYKFYPDAVHKPKEMPLVIKKMPFTDSDIPQELHNLHFGKFAIVGRNGKKHITNDYSTFKEEKKMARAKTKKVKADAANVRIYNILKKKSYPLEQYRNYND